MMKSLVDNKGSAIASQTRRSDSVTGCTSVSATGPESKGSRSETSLMHQSSVYR